MCPHALFSQAQSQILLPGAVGPFFVPDVRAVLVRLVSLVESCC